MLPSFPTTLHIGFVPIQMWGFFVALGMICSFIIILNRGKRLGMEVEKILDMGVYMVAGGIIGARLFHVLFYQPEYFFSYPEDIIKIWQGGMSSFGGMVGAALVFYYFKRKGKISKDNILKITDLFSFAVLYGWIVGRLGCVEIHDHPGIKLNSFLSFNFSDGQRLDMAAVEIIGLLPLAAVFFLLRKKNLPDGRLSSILLIYYGVLRFVLDFFRAADIAHADERYLALTPAQYFGILFGLTGAYILYKIRLDNKGE